MSGSDEGAASGVKRKMSGLRRSWVSEMELEEALELERAANEGSVVNLDTDDSSRDLGGSVSGSGGMKRRRKVKKVKRRVIDSDEDGREPKNEGAGEEDVGEKVVRVEKKQGGKKKKKSAKEGLDEVLMVVDDELERGIEEIASGGKSVSDGAEDVEVSGVDEKELEGACGVVENDGKLSSVNRKVVNRWEIEEGETVQIGGVNRNESNGGVNTGCAGSGSGTVVDHLEAGMRVLNIQRCALGRLRRLRVCPEETMEVLMETQWALVEEVTHALMDVGRRGVTRTGEEQKMEVVEEQREVVRGEEKRDSDGSGYSWERAALEQEGRREGKEKPRKVEEESSEDRTMERKESIGGDGEKSGAIRKTSGITGQGGKSREGGNRKQVLIYDVPKGAVLDDICRWVNEVGRKEGKGWKVEEVIRGVNMVTTLEGDR